ncbi:hypothetical protein GW17_00046493 [Ensete ventricosum]|nr:hypothetical protein GW17_00046493 [Ensete ventricosum]
MPAVLVVRRAPAGGGLPTLPVSGRLYDNWGPPYNRSASYTGLATSAGRMSEGIATWQPGRHLSYQKLRSNPQE